LARQLGVSPHAIRFYEARGLLPPPERGENRYRDYTEAEAERLRLLIGLRRLDISLEQAAELATMCAAGRCDEVSEELRTLLSAKRAELGRRMDEVRFLDQRMRHLAGELDRGGAPRRLIGLGKEDEHATVV
jgi:DNA-binding transcriptional MerR regulator